MYISIYIRFISVDCGSFRKIIYIHYRSTIVDDPFPWIRVHFVNKQAPRIWNILNYAQPFRESKFVFSFQFLFTFARFLPIFLLLSVNSSSKLNRFFAAGCCTSKGGIMFHLMISNSIDIRAWGLFRFFPFFFLRALGTPC